MKYYFLRLFQELLTHDRNNEYIFFYSQENLTELGKLEGTHWDQTAIRLEDESAIKYHLQGVDLYFCPLFILWPRPLPCPTIVTIPDIQEVFYPQFFSATERAIRAHHYPESMRLADRVVTISSFSKKTFIDRHRIPPEKIAVAYPCPDHRYLDADRIARPPGLPLDPAGFLLYPANNWHHKNHEALLRALVWLKKERNLSVPLIFTGTQLSEGYPLQQKIADFGLSEQCRLFDYLTTEEMAYLYLQARGLIFPSLFEGFGLPLLEAMATGCPVLSSDAASLPEIGGEAVAYFAPGSPEAIGKAVADFWQDDDHRKALAVKGRERARLFSAAGFARSHLEAFAAAEKAFRKTRYLKQALRYSKAGRRIASLLSRFLREI
jgi:glycosyltransferase involved in cell wall biosynthesis